MRKFILTTICFSLISFNSDPAIPGSNFTQKRNEILNRIQAEIQNAKGDSARLAQVFKDVLSQGAKGMHVRELIDLAHTIPVEDGLHGPPGLVGPFDDSPEVIKYIKEFGNPVPNDVGPQDALSGLMYGAEKRPYMLIGDCSSKEILVVKFPGLKPDGKEFRPNVQTFSDYPTSLACEEALKNQRAFFSLAEAVNPEKIIEMGEMPLVSPMAVPVPETAKTRGAYVNNLVNYAKDEIEWGRPNQLVLVPNDRETLDKIVEGVKTPANVARP